MDNYHWISVASLAVIVSWFIYRLVSVLCPTPDHLKEKGRDWWWRWIILTFLFGSFAGIRSLYCFFQKPEMFEDVLNSGSLASYNLIAISVGKYTGNSMDSSQLLHLGKTVLLTILGYFTCDLLELFFNSPKWMFKALLKHHIVSMFVGVFTLYSQRYVAFTTSTFFMELNNMFLNLHRILRDMGTSGSNKLYQASLLLDVITCAIFRVLYSFWMMSVVASGWKVVPIFDFLLGFFGSTFFIHQNIQMFNKSWKIAFGKPPANYFNFVNQSSME